MKTAIILGAGASKPYNFPLGAELKQIVTQFAAKRRIQERLKQLHYQPDQLQELAECLKYSCFQTIDEFLDAKKSFREIGGYIIAESILQTETSDSIFPSNNWMATVYKKFHKKIMANEDLDISFVTLNYDRSLEYFFSKVTKYDCREDEEEIVANTLAQIPILHPHGSLGSLSELPYGQGSCDTMKIQEAGKRIQIISDKLENSPAYVAVQKQLENVDRILFVGFAYHPSTMETLLKNVDPEKTELIGSSLRLNQDREGTVKAWSKFKIKLQPVDADTFIKNNII